MQFWELVTKAALQLTAWADSTLDCEGSQNRVTAMKLEYDIHAGDVATQLP